MQPAALIDLCESDLHQLGWSVGELAYHGPNGLIWQVQGPRGGETILARAPTQSDAWQAAANQAHMMAE